MSDSIESKQTAVAEFIARWEASGSAERANYTMFLTELCALIGVPGPVPSRPDHRENAYVFERAVPMDDGDGDTTTGFIDLYKRGCFVLEAKQGSKTLRGHCDQFVPMAQDVWGRMDAGGFSTAMRRKLKHFNGGLLQESHALPVTPAQLELLIEAGESDWCDVEPAIFGTLLERRASGTSSGPTVRPDSRATALLPNLKEFRKQLPDARRTFGYCSPVEMLPTVF